MRLLLQYLAGFPAGGFEEGNAFADIWIEALPFYAEMVAIGTCYLDVVDRMMDRREYKVVVFEVFHRGRDFELLLELICKETVSELRRQKRESRHVRLPIKLLLAKDGQIADRVQPENWYAIGTRRGRGRYHGLKTGILTTGITRVSA